MIKNIVMMLLVVASESAIAEWMAVDSNAPFNNAFALYADSSTIQLIGSKVKVLFLADYKMQQVKSRYPDLKPYWSMKTETEFDCKEKLSRVISVFAYPEKMGSGVAINMSGGVLPEVDTNKWWPVPPYGHILSMMEFACGTH
ncbi:surface-adhesin E family protein [Candidatus Ferrigenium straubiae]|jgi:hypothetical protein|uniref:surface-adhesin E family protein n=1 Tax=Candidatus Ferrigenium straubiae TaxID=2919506 RepID=UPI003F4AA6E5